nr:hypothetical protein [Tanacetum cinerariifolium]
MSSPNHPTSNIKDAFSSNFLDYTTASPRYISPDPSDNLSKYLFASLAILHFHNVQVYNDANKPPIPPQDPITPPTILTLSLVLPSSPLFDPRHFFVPEELLPPKKQIHPPSSSSTTLSNSSRKQAYILVPPSFSTYTPTPPQIYELKKSYMKMHLKHHEKQVESILSYVEELSIYYIEKMEERLVNGWIIIPRDFDEVKTKLKEARTLIRELQKKRMGQINKISFIHFWISDLENTLEDIQDRLQLYVKNHIGHTSVLQVTQTIITHNAAYQEDDLDAYDSDCDDFSTAMAVFMANLSSYKLDVLSEDTNSSSQQDAMILYVFEQLLKQVTNYNKINKDNLIANESLSAELERYKERVKLLEERQNEKEAKNIDKEISLEKKVKELDNIVCKMGQSTQTVHMLTKPQVFYDNYLKQALGFQNSFYLKKAQHIRPTLYDGSVIAKEINVISIVDSEETLMLAEESRSKMLLKQIDPKFLEKKVDIKPITYAELN